MKLKVKPLGVLTSSNLNKTGNNAAATGLALNSADYIEERETYYSETGEKRSRIIRRYIKGRLLGKGGFAQCFEVTSVGSGKVYAAKVVEKKSLKEKTKQKLISEIKIHKSLNHKNIVKFERYFEDKNNVYIILEVCKSKSLSDLMRKKKRLTEEEARFFMYQIFQAVAYLHKNKIIHRDLKLGNLFLTEELEIKTGDFGLAAQLDYDGQRKRTICGTPNYLAPEILKQGGHSYEVDIWSCGVILYTLLVGVPPFEASDVNTIYRRIKNNIYKFPCSIKISDTAKNLIKKMLNPDPAKRPNVNQVLADDFFTCTTYCSSSPTECPESLVKSMIPVEKVKNKVEGENKKVNEIKAEKSKIKEENENKKINEAKVEKRENKEKVDVKNKKLDEPKSKFILRVTAYQDFSQDYGWAYRLSNGLTGAFFNDHTKMVYNHQSGKVDYVFNKKEAEGLIEEAVGFPNIETSYPKDITKKMLLIKYFKHCLDKKAGQLPILEDHLIDQTRATKEVQPCLEMEEYGGEKPYNYPYVKNLIKTNNSLVFRMSDKTTQVIFKDNTEIIYPAEEIVHFT